MIFQYKLQFDYIYSQLHQLYDIHCQRVIYFKAWI